MLWRKRLVLTVISKTLARQLFFFGVVGVLATATHYLVALFSHEYLSVSLYLANLIGYLCAVMVSYHGHGKVTFQHAMGHRVFMRFAVMSVTTFALSEILLLVLERYAGISHRISLLAVVLSIPLLSFLLAKLWVFRHAEDSGNLPVADNR